MENSHIEWTDHTFNPWEGCTKVSPGCAHCYAEGIVEKRFKRAVWGKGNPRSRTSEANWRKPLAWNRKAQEIRQRYRVFCASLADVFDPEVDDSWREDLFKLIEQTPNLDWLLLTKRPQVAALPVWSERIAALPQIWLGTSVEDQTRANERIPILREIPAHTRFLSCEPLIAPLKLNDLSGIHWVIVGGESGPGFRPMKEEWVTDIRDQCLSAGVAFHFKQWGGSATGKKKAGRGLEGRTWDEFPPSQLPPPAKLLSKPALTTEDRKYLRDRERLVHQAVKSSLMAAKALHEILTYKNGLLWRRSHSSFAEYCQSNWGYAKAHGYRLAEAGEFMTLLESQSPIGDQPVLLPRNEAQIRPVLKLPKERRVDFWHSKVIDIEPKELTGTAISGWVEDFAQSQGIANVAREPKSNSAPDPHRLLEKLRLALQEHPNSKALTPILQKLEKLL